MRPKLTYANIMATIAVFIALGGASYAALKLPKNSVGAKQLKKNAVTTAKIKKEAVTAAKVKNGTLTGQQINVARLGKVPAAVDADTVGGVGLAGLLRSDHVITGRASANDPGNFLLRDDRTGLEVLSGEYGRLRLVNTNTQDKIVGSGVGFISPTVHATEITLAPGEHIDLAYEATSFRYGQYLLMRIPSGDPLHGVPLQLTCSERTTGSGEALSCVGVG